ncbi:hypothetical protein HYU13_00590 [Candidatus Woesearchaeota archaeon]|nr:hypothetical protein [Candidatus Woesearchaeota archaeon]
MQKESFEDIRIDDFTHQRAKALSEETLGRLGFEALPWFIRDPQLFQPAAYLLLNKVGVGQNVYHMLEKFTQRLASDLRDKFPNEREFYRSIFDSGSKSLVGLHEICRPFAVKYLVDGQRYIPLRGLEEAIWKHAGVEPDSKMLAAGDARRDLRILKALDYAENRFSIITGVPVGKHKRFKFVSPPVAEFLAFTEMLPHFGGYNDSDEIQSRLKGVFLRSPEYYGRMILSWHSFRFGAGGFASEQKAIVKVLEQWAKDGKLSISPCIWAPKPGVQ